MRALLPIAVTALLAAPAARADDALHHHQFKAGEVIRYDFEDTDRVFSALRKDGAIQAGDGLLTQEISIPVEIVLQPGKGGLERKLTLSPSARYRQGPTGELAKTPFKPVAELAKGLPASFSYSYKDDRDALDHLQTTFQKVRGDEVGRFLFFKTQDIHQMQESAEKIPEGMLPGETYSSPRHERQGLGGEFIAAPAELIYQGTATLDGVKCGYFKSVSMGHQFTLPTMKTWTNFFFTMHVALEGPLQGLMLLGEGQETAVVLKGKEKEPQAVLQRQFSIRLRR